jgi:hypothetical protein
MKLRISRQWKRVRRMTNTPKKKELCGEEWASCSGEKRPESVSDYQPILSESSHSTKPFITPSTTISSQRHELLSSPGSKSAPLCKAMPCKIISFHQRDSFQFYQSQAKDHALSVLTSHRHQPTRWVTYLSSYVLR